MAWVELLVSMMLTYKKMFEQAASFIQRILKHLFYNLVFFSQIAKNISNECIYKQAGS